jgi:hypothetical protein
VLSVRFLIALISFVGYGLQYMQRVNMSSAIVCMLNNTALRELALEELALKELSITTTEALEFSSSDIELRTNSSVDIEPISDESCYFKQAVSKKLEVVSIFIRSSFLMCFLLRIIMIHTCS